MADEAYSVRTDCRLCFSPELHEVLTLTPTPLANEFLPRSRAGEPQDRFPLHLVMCQACRHVQLPVVVDPKRLFRDYVYVSGTSPVFVDHFRRYAEDLMSRLGSTTTSIVEIGSNDGTLLRFFSSAGMEVLGIDPAVSIAESATSTGIETLPEFFTSELARSLRASRGQAGAVVANNVMAHIDGLADVVEGVRELLRPDGLFVFEVSYLVDVVEKTLFDTIYHEHLAYHTVAPLEGFLSRGGLELLDVIRVPTHGGSIRVIAQPSGGPRSRSPGIEQLLRIEDDLDLISGAGLTALSENIAQRGNELRAILGQVKEAGKSIVGFGAPAKATTLMFHFGIGPEIVDFIVDDSPLKQGLVTPGHHIPVVPSDRLYGNGDRPPDYALILAWNFAGPIMDNHRSFTERGGHFVVPLPNVEVH